MVLKKAQMKIQQMAFMIVAVLLFFTLAGLFLLQIFMGDITRSIDSLEREQVIQSLKYWSEMPEFSCSDKSVYCLDEDKLIALQSNEMKQIYKNYWPVSSIRVYKITDKLSSNLIKCPAEDCNYFDIFYDEDNPALVHYSTYTVICRKETLEEQIYENCQLGKIELGKKKTDS